MIYPLSEESLAYAARAISSGSLAAFPTETVYGLGADAFNPQALAKIFEAKGRPRFDPLIVHIARLETLEEITDRSRLSEAARDQIARLTAEFWPGPLTLILPKRERVPGLATSGLPTVAVRFPAHPVAQRLILLSTGAVAAPSANRFGCLSPTRAEHVAEQLGDRVDIILDGGPSTIGLESTVLDMSGPQPRILRPGGVSRERLERLIGPLAPDAGVPPLAEAESARRSPGTLKSHYAPRTPLSLHSPESMAALSPEADLGYIFFSARSRDRWRVRPPENETVKILSEQGDSVEAAANLFDVLYQMDKLGLRRIHAEMAPQEALGEAINDRLSRASQH